MNDAEAFTGRGGTTLPGYFRPTKDWDVVAVAQENLLATIEVKSHAGPSYGNNFNNRIEEALGSATDFWSAYRRGVFRLSSRPFLGYLMLLEEDDKQPASSISRRACTPCAASFRTPPMQIDIGCSAASSCANVSTILPVS